MPTAHSCNFVVDLSGKEHPLHFYILNFTTLRAPFASLGELYGVLLPKPSVAPGITPNPVSEPQLVEHGCLIQQIPQRTLRRSRLLDGVTATAPTTVAAHVQVLSTQPSADAGRVACFARCEARPVGGLVSGCGGGR